MNHFSIAILNSPLEPLTYQSKNHLAIGTKVTVFVRSKEVEGVVVGVCDKPSFECLEILESSGFCYSSKQLELARFISSYYFCSLGESLGIMTPFASEASASHSFSVGLKSHFRVNEADFGNEASVSHSFSAGLKSHFRVDETCFGSEASASLSFAHTTLSDKQNEALEFLKKHPVSLLFGDTGSGKTEIYMRYFEEMLLQKKRSIFLMPEISLTPQMSKRFKLHFGESVVFWHSKLSPTQKKKALASIYDGSAMIVAGPRSALFLPIEDLGLVVVDEEHDDSYKSSSRPRYNARDIAIYMGKVHNVPVVLGSATPSLTSYVKFAHFRLKGGYFNAKKEFIYERSVETLSPLVVQYLQKSVEQREQSIFFLPTRANFKYLICGDCGYTYKCVFCSVGMSVHQKSRSLKCHYCNFAQAIPQKCSECGSGHLVSSRLGTAEALKEVREQIGKARVEQFDRDTITTAKKLEEMLERFNAKEIDILIGTQMLSKGHDYHGVALAVVLGMDNMLGMSDYRAREKALSTLIQVAGRSGRKESAKVLVQSFNEEFFKTFVQDYEAFLEDEKEYRKELYPPYKKLCRVLFSHKNGVKAQEAMHDMVERLRAFTTVEIVGFGKCGIERMADKYRFEILLRSDRSTEIIKAVSACKNALAEIDMDPVEFG